MTGIALIAWNFVSIKVFINSIHSDSLAKIQVSSCRYLQHQFDDNVEQYRPFILEILATLVRTVVRAVEGEPLSLFTRLKNGH